MKVKVGPPKSSGTSPHDRRNLKLTLQRDQSHSGNKHLEALRACGTNRQQEGQLKAVTGVSQHVFARLDRNKPQSEMDFVIVCLAWG